MNNLDVAVRTYEVQRLSWVKEYVEILRSIVGECEIIASKDHGDFVVLDVLRSGQVAQVILNNLPSRTKDQGADAMSDGVAENILVLVFLKYYEDPALLDRIAEQWRVETLGAEFASLGLFDVHKPYPMEGFQQYLTAYKDVNLEGAKILFHELKSTMNMQATVAMQKLEEVQSLYKHRLLSMAFLSNTSSLLLTHYLFAEYVSDFSLQLLFMGGLAMSLTFVLNYIDHLYYDWKRYQDVLELDQEHSSEVCSNKDSE